MAKGKRKGIAKPSPPQTQAEPEKSAERSTKGRSFDKIRITTAPVDMAFGRMNYLLMITGVFFMVLGYILMAGGGSDDPNVFNPDIFGFRRITFAPLMIMLGIGIEIYAILKKAD